MFTVFKRLAYGLFPAKVERGHHKNKTTLKQKEYEQTLWHGFRSYNYRQEKGNLVCFGSLVGTIKLCIRVFVAISEISSVSVCVMIEVVQLMISAKSDGWLASSGSHNSLRRLHTVAGKCMHSFSPFLGAVESHYQPIKSTLANGESRPVLSLASTSDEISHKPVAYKCLLLWPLPPMMGRQLKASRSPAADVFVGHSVVVYVSENSKVQSHAGLRADLPSDRTPVALWKSP